MTIMLGLMLSGSSTWAAEGNLLANTSFEESDSGNPVSWTQDVWNQGKDVTRFSVTKEAFHSGGASVLIENLQPNDAKWVQKVVVKPETTYRLSGYIKVERADTGSKGGNLSFMGIVDTSEDHKNTVGQWQFVQMYGKTGANQKEITVAARLGGYGSLTTGKAYFDDISLEEASTVPSGSKVVSLDPGTGSTGQTTSGEPVSAMSIAAYAVIFVMLFFFLFNRYVRPDDKGFLPSDGKERISFFILLLIVGFLLRLYIAGKSPGYLSDMATFAAWASRAAETGLSKFYLGVWVDYPPGYIYVLYILGKIGQALHFAPGSQGMTILLKLPACLADLAIGWLVYRHGAKHLGSRAALGLAALFIFNPAVLGNSASWGQVDSFFTLILLIALLLAVKGRLEWGTVLFALAVLVKPQGLIYTPALLYLFYRKGSWKRFGVSAAAGLAAFVALVLPFSIHNDALWIYQLYKTTLESYPYVSLNAFNFYTLIGQNWEPMGKKLLFLSYGQWGTVFIVASVALSAYLYLRKKGNESEKTWFVALLLIVMVYLFGVKMHERYLFPALALAMFAFIQSKDRRLLFLFTAFSVTHYINVAYVLANSQVNLSAIPRYDGILLAISLAQVCLFGWLVKIGYDLFIRNRHLPVPKREKLTALPAKPEEAGLLHTPESSAWMGRLSRRDWILMGSVTLLYALLAFYHLGSHSAPTTYWQPAKTEDGFTVDFGSVKTLDRVNTFSEIGEGKFKLEFADKPGGAWTSPIVVDNTYVKVFTWNVQSLNLPARYVKVTVESPGFTLNEMAFFEAGNDKPLVVSTADVEGTSPPIRGSVDRLFDEQEKAKLRPTYMDGTYFDEIYHARTAYENIHGIKAYENTHPPLGKVIIAAGIQLFGMNPFGWRVAGTLVGIGMLPLFYIMAFRLFRRTEYAFLATFLMACEFMHFAQTRIATIDVYGVFFIMLMFYFMYRYYSLDFYRTPLRKTLVPLFFSGLFFGIGAASKWIVLYGGAGLAVIFFLSLYERYRQYAAAGEMLKLKEKNPQVLASLYEIRKVFVSRTIKTVAWCSLFFVVIPTIIYSLSFAPIISVPGEKHTAGQLVQYQKDMWNYHSKLKATHSFSSPWYEWPFIVKPIWFYSGQSQVPEGKVSSIVSMGNPAIWWVGIGAVVAAVVLCKRQKHRGMFVMLVAFFSQYVPWMLVTRLTFIYHFFAMVPFLILCIVYTAKYLTDKKPSRKKWVYAYSAVCFLLFVLFYPILSGAVVSKTYVADVLRWFPSWFFYS